MSIKTTSHLPSEVANEIFLRRHALEEVKMSELRCLCLGQKDKFTNLVLGIILSYQSQFSNFG